MTTATRTDGTDTAAPRLQLQRTGKAAFLTAAHAAEGSYQVSGRGLAGGSAGCMAETSHQRSHPAQGLISMTSALQGMTQLCGAD